MATDLKYTEAKPSRIFNYNRKFYIKLTVDGQIRQTNVSTRTNTPEWADIFYLCVLVIGDHAFHKKAHVYSHSHARDAYNLTLEIYVNHTGRSDERVGRIEGNLAVLLSEKGKSLHHHCYSVTMTHAFGIVVHRKLENRPDSKRAQSTVEFHVASADTDPTAPEVHWAQEDVEKLGFVPFPDLLRKVDTFVKLVTGIFEVYIFAAKYISTSEIEHFLG